MIKTIFMYLFTFTGIILLGYVRIHGADRIKKDPTAQGWTDQEKKLIYVAFALIIVGLIFTLFVK